MVPGVRFCVARELPREMEKRAVVGAWCLLLTLLVGGCHQAKAHGVPVPIGTLNSAYYNVGIKQLVLTFGYAFAPLEGLDSYSLVPSYSVNGHEITLSLLAEVPGHDHLPDWIQVEVANLPPGQYTVVDQATGHVIGTVTTGEDIKRNLFGHP